MRKLSELIQELQEIYDEIGECNVYITRSDDVCCDNIPVLIGPEYYSYNTITCNAVSQENICVMWNLNIGCVYLYLTMVNLSAVKLAVRSVIRRKLNNLVRLFQRRDKWN